SFWSELHGYEIDRRLAEQTGMAVIIENDANAGALAELTFGQGRAVRNFCYLLLGHGLGAGLVHDGALFRGGWSNAGEIGRILIQHHGES
ncbi:ROK family protein, partial [Escherichia coli]